MKKINLRIWVIVILLIFFKYTNCIAQMQWFEQTTPVSISLNSVSAVNDNVVWACGGYGYWEAQVIRTTDGGTWMNATGTGILYQLELTNIWGIDENNALVTGTDISSVTYVYKTTNGGLSWIQVFSQSGGFINAVQLTSANDGFMVGDPVMGRWSMWNTTDAGFTWDSSGLYVPEYTNLGWLNSLFISGSNYWFGTQDNYIMHSSDYGNTWSHQITTQSSSYAIWFNNSNTGLAGGYICEFDRTTNGGSNWYSMTSLPLYSFIFGITGSGQEWWLCSGTNTPSKIWYSSNNGASWSVQYSKYYTQYSHISKARTGSNIWAVGTINTISKYGLTNNLKSNSNEIPSKYYLTQNFPNPFNPTTSIKFDIPKSSYVRLIVYDILGKEAATLVNEKLIAGSYEVDWIASNYHSGVYFYKIKSGDYVNVKKMLLVK